MLYQTKQFIGLSRSTFSSLIALKRFIDGNGDSYIYNLNNDILRRTDAGLQMNACICYNKKNLYCQLESYIRKISESKKLNNSD